MEGDPDSPPIEMEATLPSPEIDLSTLPRLNSSTWGVDKLGLAENPTLPSIKNILNTDINFSIDKLTKFNASKDRSQNGNLGQKRKNLSNSKGKNFLHPRKNIKVTFHPQNATKKCNCTCLIHDNSSSVDFGMMDSPIVIEEPSKIQQNKFNSAEEAIFSARDNIIKAYELTSDRNTQTKFLDLLNIFRSFTESKFQHLPNYEKTSNKSNSKGENVTSQSSGPSRTEQTKGGPKSYAQALGKAQDTTLPPAMVPARQSSQLTTGQGNKITPEKKVITLVISNGSEVPVYQPTTIRDAVNKALGKIAISRVHTSPRNNIVLTCFQSSPEELLENQPKWTHVFFDWPISKVQKVEQWPTLVIHGVPTCIPITNISKEISSFNANISVQDKPRWLSNGPPKTAHGSLAVTVGSEEEKLRILKTGLLIGGLLLKAVNYKSNTERTLFDNCLKYGHHRLMCKRRPVCAICLGNHNSKEQSCSSCKSSDNCQHHPLKCSNCKSSKHNALQKKDCEFYKALS